MYPQPKALNAIEIRKRHSITIYNHLMSMSESIALYETANIKWAVPSQPTPIKVIGMDIGDPL